MAAAPWRPAGAARGCPGTSAERPEPRRDPGFPQTPSGGRHSLDARDRKRKNDAGSHQVTVQSHDETHICNETTLPKLGGNVAY